MRSSAKAVFCGFAAVAGAVGLPGMARAAGLDGWSDAPDGSGIVAGLTAVTGIGNTTGVGALRVEIPQGSFWGPQTGNVIDALIAGATRYTYDLTYLNIELNGGSYSGGADNSFNGFAQGNTLVVNIAAPAGGFIQRNFNAAVDTDSRNLGTQWSGVDGVRTISWDLSTFTSGGLSIQQFIAANNSTEAHIWMVTQGSDSNGNAGPMRFYFDNAFFTIPGGATQVVGDFEPIPEPSAAAMVGFAALPLLGRRRGRRG